MLIFQRFFIFKLYHLIGWNISRIITFIVVLHIPVSYCLRQNQVSGAVVSVNLQPPSTKGLALSSWNKKRMLKLKIISHSM
jgi:hypothetical protein